MSLAKAKLEVQREVTSVKRSAKNPHFKNNYATLDDVVNGLRPSLLEHGIEVRQKTKGVSYEAERGLVTVQTIVTHVESGEVDSVDTILPLSKDDAQGVGSGITYACRYALMAYFLVPPTDDDAEAAREDGALGEAVIEQKRLMRLVEALKDNLHAVNLIKREIADGDLSVAAEAWFELDDDAKKSLWVAPTKGGPFTAEERATIKSNEFRDAHFGAPA